MIEISGYVLVVVGMFAGFVSPRFAILFVVLANLYGMLSSQLAAGIETFLFNRYPRLRDRATLFLAAMLAIGGPAAVATAHEPRSGFRKVRVPPSMAVY